MRDRIKGVQRKPFLLSLAVGASGLVLVFSPVAFVTPAIAEGVDIEVPVIGQTPTPAPTLETPVIVPVGVTVSEAAFEISLVGLEPFSLVEVYANSEPVLLASGFADASGEFFAEVKLPPNLAIGDHSITASNTLPDGTKKTITIVEFTVLPGGKLAKAGSNAGGNSSIGGVPNEVPVSEDEEQEFLDSNPLNLSGVFYVGGFQSSATYDVGGILNPGAKISMYINNAYTKSASGTLKFWVRNPVGLVVAESEPLAVKPLSPGETRLVSFRFEEIGQWGAYTSHLSFTPDKSVNAGIEIPYLRSESIFVFSWAALTIAILCTAILTGARFPLVRDKFLPAIYSRNGRLEE